MLGIFGILALVASGVIAVSVRHILQGDHTIVDRMGSSDRFDGADEPHAHMPHSHI